MTLKLNGAMTATCALSAVAELLVSIAEIGLKWEWSIVLLSMQLTQEQYYYFSIRASQIADATTWAALAGKNTSSE